MTTNRKAILLSALVLPGLGQFTLKRYKRGISIVLIVLFSFYKVMSVATERANEIVNKMMSQGGVVDLQSISNAASSAGSASYNYYVWIIIACWLVSLIDIALLKSKV